jgi:hypothetical protein
MMRWMLARLKHADFLDGVVIGISITAAIALIWTGAFR